MNAANARVSRLLARLLRGPVLRRDAATSSSHAKTQRRRARPARRALPFGWRASPALRAAAAALVGAALVAATSAHAAPPERPKVIVLGFDGLDANRTERLMEEGRLPTFKRLRDLGGYSKLRPSNPAQSPVSWASITTGWNPGKTGIYDFVRRKDMDPTRLDIGLAERRYVEPLAWWRRAALLCAAGLLGAIAGGGLAFAGGVRWPSLRRGRPFEAALTGGAALFACATFVVVQWVPDRVPTAVNLRSGEPFWKTLDRAGVRSVALEGPLCFPPEDMTCGSCLAGLGVPDMAGTWGSFSVWSDDVTLPGTTEMAGTGFFVDPGTDAFDVLVGGPANPCLAPEDAVALRRAAKVEAKRRGLAAEWTRAQKRASETVEAKLQLGLRLVAKLQVAVRRGAGADVTLQDGTSVSLVPGTWTDLLPVVFEANPVVKLRGRVRLLLEDAGAPAAAGRTPKPFRLFVGQVQWDLANVPPNVGLTAPRSFAPEILKATGPIETIGWPEMTNPVKERMLSDQAFLDHTYMLMALREKRLYAEIAKGGFDCLFAMFPEPDRVQHALYRHVDPLCPTHDPAVAKRFAPEIDKIYVEADRIVATTLAQAPKDAIVLVVSDHGFAPFRRGVNLNSVLRSKGWQTPRQGGTAATGIEVLGTGDTASTIDWARTKAYATGLGNVYVNLAGREPRGCVPLSQYDEVVDALAKDIEAVTDTDGTKVVSRVFKGKDLYHGARTPEAPDLVVGFAWGYRVSWQTALGEAGDAIVSPNTFPWSGDHCSVDPDLVPAVLFSTVPLRVGAAPKVEDVAPAALSLYGVAPIDPDGSSFLR